MQENNVKIIGARLKTFREDIIGDQATLAKEAGVNAKTISFVENGHRDPTQKLLSFLSSKYKLNQDWLTTGKGERQSDEKMDDKYIHNLHAKVVSLEMELSQVKNMVQEILHKLS